MREYLRQMGAVLWKDLLVEIRTGDRLAAMGAFSILVGVLFNYAVDPTVVRPQEIAAGMIWLAVLFAGLLGLGRTFHLEDEEEALQGILMSPIPRDALYLGKVLANFVLVFIVVVLVFGVFAIFFDLTFGGNLLLLLAVVGLGTLGFVALGTLFSGISSRTRMGETLLPVLVFPLLVPLVIYGVSATSRLFAGRPFSEVEGSLRMLGAFALVALAVGAVLFRFVVEE